MNSILYLALMAYFAFIPALIIGALLSLINNEFGLVMFGVVFAWRFIELVSMRKSKW